MPRVLILCHLTNRPLPTGLVLDAAGFAAEQGDRFAPPCPHCQHTHPWTKAMAWLEQTETETRDHACPVCGSRAIVGRGRVLASAAGIRADYRCAQCAHTFVVLLATPLMDEE